jgi:hypothetical protein
VRKLATVGMGLLLAALAAGCGGTRTVVQTVTVAPSALSALRAMADQKFYGRIKSLERKSDRYELRFDPAWLVTGLTANVAQAEDEGTPCQPNACPPVANDSYVIEGTRLVTFVVPANVRGTVLGTGGSNGLRSLTITTAQLAELVAGTSSLKLFEPSRAASGSSCTSTRSAPSRSSTTRSASRSDGGVRSASPRAPAPQR